MPVKMNDSLMPYLSHDEFPRKNDAGVQVLHKSDGSGRRESLKQRDLFKARTCAI